MLPHARQSTQALDWATTPTPGARRRVAETTGALSGELHHRHLPAPDLSWTADPAAWRARVLAVRGCARPIHLDGQWRVEHADTGDTLTERSGLVFAPCNNRRSSVCQSCSDRYAADAFHLIRAGLCGGKTVPATVATAPRLFVTLTAPSFGPVHSQRTTRTGKRIPCACGVHHLNADTRLGSPIDPDGYDYPGAVLWQAHAGELWHRFTIRVRRELARSAGIKVRDFARHARISYAKVAEYQRRGLIHFHAVIRLDGPDGPADPPPAWADEDTLTVAVRLAAERTDLTRTLPTPTGRDRVYRFTWGAQLDVRAIEPADATRIEDGGGTITDTALAGYIAKYATKGTSTSEAADRPVRSERDIEHLTISAHHKTMIRTAWVLGGLSGLEFVRRWAHMLGFRGHFLSKSKHYSTSFTDMRAERKIWHVRQIADAHGVSEEDIVVINDWRTVGAGYASEDENELAHAIAERMRQNRIDQSRKESAA